MSTFWGLMWRGLGLALPVTLLACDKKSWRMLPELLAGAAVRRLKICPQSEAGAVSFQVHQIERVRSARIGDSAIPSKGKLLRSAN